MLMKRGLCVVASNTVNQLTPLNKRYVLNRLILKNNTDAKMVKADMEIKFAKTIPSLALCNVQPETKYRLMVLHKVYGNDFGSTDYKNMISMRNYIKEIIQEDSVPQEVIDYCVEFMKTRNAW